MKKLYIRPVHCKSNETRLLSLVVCNTNDDNPYRKIIKHFPPHMSGKEIQILLNEWYSDELLSIEWGQVIFA